MIIFVILSAIFFANFFSFAQQFDPWKLLAAPFTTTTFQSPVVLDSLDLEISLASTRASKKCLLTSSEMAKCLASHGKINKFVIIVHGYEPDFNIIKMPDWIPELTHRILAYDNSGSGSGLTGVIIVHWGLPNKRLLYSSWAKKTKDVGCRLAGVIDGIKKISGYGSAYFYCIGHSLGAHTCGFAGKYLNSAQTGRGGLDRITGLDPAGFKFTDDYSQVTRTITEVGSLISASLGQYPEVDADDVTFARLASGDAAYVDVVHTDGLGVLFFGTMEPMGDVDFYPGNSGSYGHHPLCCSVSDIGGHIIVNGLDLCAHFEAVRLFMDSISDKEKSCEKVMKCEIPPRDFSKSGCIEVKSSLYPKFGYWSNEVGSNSWYPYYYKNRRGIFAIELFRDRCYKTGFYTR